MTEFLWGIKNGELEGVKKYVSEKGRDVVNQEIEGRYPLHYAADYGQPDVLGYLIKQGANINQEDKHNITPLLAAVWEGHTECVKLLLENGANNEVTSPDGTPVIECAEKDEIKKLLELP